MRLRIAPEILEQHIVALGRRQLDKTFRPELLKPRQCNALGLRARAHLVVDPLAPCHLVASLRECALIPETLRQRAEDVEIVPGFTDRIDRAVHGQHEGVAR